MIEEAAKLQAANESAELWVSHIHLAADPEKSRDLFVHQAIITITDSRFDKDAEKRTSAFIAAAKDGDRLARAALNHAIAWLIDNGEQIPAALRAYLVEFLRDGPSLNTKTAHDHILRDHLISMAVKAVMAHGFSRTRKRGQSGEPSACSIVHACLEAHGYRAVGESRIEQISEEIK